MRRNIKMCIDRIVPDHLLREAMRRAIDENPANVPVFRDLPGLGVEPSPLRMAILTGKKWQNGRELKVHFMDGVPAVQAKVEHYAHQWSQYANITFKFGYDPGADIRISFEQEGSWSYLGTDALTIPRPQPTMNYGWLTPESQEEEYRRVVVHEFPYRDGAKIETLGRAPHETEWQLTYTGPNWRDDFLKLARSPVMKPVDAQPVWSIVCFVVPAPYRGQGVASALLEAAVQYARKRGARLVEAYPMDRAGRVQDDWMWHGALSMFQRAGFSEVARRRPQRPIVRRALAPAARKR